MTATIMLSTTKEASTAYDMKKGTAKGEPQHVPTAQVSLGSQVLGASGCEAGVTMQSCMIPFQLSPVAQRNIVRNAVPGQG